MQWRLLIDIQTIDFCAIINQQFNCWHISVFAGQVQTPVVAQSNRVGVRFCKSISTLSYHINTMTYPSLKVTPRPRNVHFQLLKLTEYFFRDPWHRWVGPKQSFSSKLLAQRPNLQNAFSIWRYYFDRRIRRTWDRRNPKSTRPPRRFPFDSPNAVAFSSPSQPRPLERRTPEATRKSQLNRQRTPREGAFDFDGLLPKIRVTSNHSP